MKIWATHALGVRTMLDLPIILKQFVPKGCSQGTWVRTMNKGSNLTHFSRWDSSTSLMNIVRTVDQDEIEDDHRAVIRTEWNVEQDFAVQRPQQHVA